MGIELNLGKVFESKHIYSIVFAIMMFFVFAFLINVPKSISIIICLFSFMLIEGLIFILKRLNKTIEKKNKRKKYEAYQLKVINYYAQSVRIKFKTMNSQMRESAMVLFRTNSQNLFSNERFISQESDAWSATFAFRDTFNGQPFELIKVVGNDSPVCVVFDTLFYVILKNYVENGIDEYPVALDLKSYLQNYSHLFE